MSLLIVIHLINEVKAKNLSVNIKRVFHITVLFLESNLKNCNMTRVTFI